MTAIVGIRCKDAIVIGTDSSTTFSAGQFSTIEQPSEKLEVIRGQIIVAGTGPVGMGQRFCQIIDQAWTTNKFHGAPTDVGKLLAKNAVLDFAETQAPKGVFGALVAFPLEHKFHLCEFDTNNFQPELKTEKLWYCSMGSSQLITDPFLAFIREVFWSDGTPSTSEGIFSVTWTLDHAIRINPGGVNGPIRIAVLQNKSAKEPEARILDDNELDEHRQNIKESKDALRKIQSKYKSVKVDAVPSIPKPSATTKM